MPNTIFYAWQSDTDESTNHQFIGEAIKCAIRQLNVDLELDESAEAFEFDRDIHDEPGTPAVADTILKKIANAAMFVADVTYVAHNVGPRGKSVPNANVSFELGFAARAIGFERIVCVLNEHSGAPTQRPFDVAHRKYPVPYLLAPDASEPERARQLKTLSEALEREFRNVWKHISYGNDSAASQEPAHAAAPLEDCSFVDPGSPLVTRTPSIDSEGRASEYVYWHHGPSAWLRVLPVKPLNLRRGPLAQVIAQSSVPLTAFGGGRVQRPVTNDRGVVMLGFDGEHPDSLATRLTQIFGTGEIWGLNKALVEPRRTEPTRTIIIPWPATAATFERALRNYLDFARRTLHIEPPVIVIAGLAMVRDAAFVQAVQAGPGPEPHRCLLNFVRAQWTLDTLEIEPSQVLAEFYGEIWDACGLVYPH